MRFEIGGNYHMSVDEFGKMVFFDADFNDYLHLTGLNFRGYEIREVEQADGRRSRVLVRSLMSPFQSHYNDCSAVGLRTLRMVSLIRCLEAGRPMYRYPVWRKNSQYGP